MYTDLNLFLSSKNWKITDTAIYLTLGWVFTILFRSPYFLDLLLVKKFGCYLLMLQFLLLYVFPYFWQTDRNRCGPDSVSSSLKSNYSSSPKHGEREQSQFLLNYNIPEPDQIDSGDGCSNVCAVEADWTWSGTVEAIHDNEHSFRLLFIFLFSVLSLRFISFFI